jgi:hypothetical protein
VPNQNWFDWVFCYKKIPRAALCLGTGVPNEEIAAVAAVDVFNLSARWQFVVAVAAAANGLHNLGSKDPLADGTTERPSNFAGSNLIKESKLQ